MLQESSLYESYKGFSSNRYCYSTQQCKSTLQMFTGVCGAFMGKSECGDFKFTGIACYLLSLQSF